MSRWTASLAVLAWATSLAAATPAPSPISGPAATPSAAAPADFVAVAQHGLDGELAVLDGGPLSGALAAAAHSGRTLRLILDPSHRSTRQQGVSLAAVSPTAQVRWSLGAGRHRRWLRADSGACMSWKASEGTTLGVVLGCPAEADGFPERWLAAAPALPEAQNLDDQLHSLPDPRENAPHFIRRRQRAGE